MPTDEANRSAVIEHLACLRSVVLGTTLRNYLAALAAGTCDEGPLASVPHRCVRAYYARAHHFSFPREKYLFGNP